MRETKNAQRTFLAKTRAPSISPTLPQTLTRAQGAEVLGGLGDDVGAQLEMDGRRERSDHECASDRKRLFFFFAAAPPSRSSPSLTVISMRPRGASLAVMSKKTTGLAMVVFVEKRRKKKKERRGKRE